MNHLPLITKREYLNKVKNKSFIIMTFVSPLIMIGLGLLIGFLTNLNKNKERIIDVVDESGYAKEIFSDTTSTTKYRILNNIDLAQARVDVEEQEHYGLLYIPKIDSVRQLEKNVKFYSKDTPSLTLIADLESKIEKSLTDINYKNNGFNIEKIREARIRIDINQESYTGEKTSKLSGGLKLAFGMASGYLLFMFIIIYGNMIMRSIIEEKTSRIIEVIISSVKPMQLMLGKIFGTSLAGITQFVIWVLLLSVLSVVLSSVFGVNMSEMQSAQQEAMQNGDVQEKISLLLNEMYNLPLANLIVMFLLFFIGGFLLYSSLYAAIGAAVDNETDTQQFMMPIMVPLILAVYVGGFTVLEDPHGTVAQVFSFIPFTSPVVMLMRIPFGVPMWQQILSVVILFATFIGAVWFAAKIYKVGILMYGKKASYKEIYKWLKY